jgi:hypothetical protein
MKNQILEKNEYEGLKIQRGDIQIGVLDSKQFIEEEM